VTGTELQEWLDRYGLAWSERDPEAVAGLFSPEARYHETPFAPPSVGREEILRYWQQVPRSQREISFRAAPLGIVNGTCIVRWQAEFTRVASGERVELDGVFLLEFDERGLCVELREWWHRR